MFRLITFVGATVSYSVPLQYHDDDSTAAAASQAGRQQRRADTNRQSIQYQFQFQLDRSSIESCPTKKTARGRRYGNLHLARCRGATNVAVGLSSRTRRTFYKRRVSAIICETSLDGLSRTTRHAAVRRSPTAPEEDIGIPAHASGISAGAKVFQTHRVVARQ